MDLPTYSSLTAFLAHRAALRELAAPTAAQRELLQWMDGLLSLLAERDRAGLESADLRHRERARRTLLRLLRERGVVMG
jgi:hypothetical protein